MTLFGNRENGTGSLFCPSRLVNYYKLIRSLLILDFTSLDNAVKLHEYHTLWNFNLRVFVAMNLIVEMILLIVK